MVRVLEVALLILSLVACPYRCMAESVGPCGAGRAEPSRSCCERCRKGQPDRSTSTRPVRNEAPAPADEGQCDCLCRGAVLKDDGAAQVLAFAAALDAGTVVSSRPLSASDLPLRPDEGPPGADEPSGRSLRFVLQSLQL